MPYSKYDMPTPSFPYKIKKRLNLMGIPRRYIVDSGEGMPPLSSTGVRKSALKGMASDRTTDAAWPWLRRLILSKRMYRHRFSQERLERMDRMIEASNATIYSKLANCVIDLKKQDTKKKKGWSESEWKKHMDYIGQIANPKKSFEPEPVKRGERKPLEELLPRINLIATLPEYKMYRRLSQEAWYRDPIKVPPNALKYKISDRVKKLAEHRVVPTQD